MSKPVRVAVLVLLVVVVLGAVAAYKIGGPSGPRLADVEARKAPRIVSLPPTKVLVVTAQGDPDAVGKEAFGLLMTAYYKLDDVPKGGADFSPPRARWPLGTDTPADQWIGHYAIPVPDGVDALPEVTARPGMTLALATWPYGDVAEILHVGPYDQEGATVAALHDFIAQSGYEVAGDHEEEYLRGPGMLFAGDPDGYLTVIRYEVRKK